MSRAPQAQVIKYFGNVGKYRQSLQKTLEAIQRMPQSSRRDADILRIQQQLSDNQEAKAR